MANSRVYLKSEAGGTTVVSRDTTAVSGNLVLPASGNVASVDTVVTDNAIARYDGTTGKLQNSGVTIDDNNNVKANSFGAVGETKTHYISTDSNIGGTNAFRIARYANSGAFEAVPLTIDASGNVGIGTTPSAWDSSFKALQINNNALFGTNANYFNVTSNAYHDGSWKYKNSGSTATNYQQSGGGHYWLTAPSGTAGNPITWTNAMALGGGTLNIYSNIPDGASMFQATNQFDNGYTTIAATGTGTYWGSAHDQVLEFVPASGGNGAISAYSGSLKFFTSGRNERMRIDASGNVGIGVTPSAWGSSWKVLDLPGAAFTGAYNNAYMFSNIYVDSGNTRYKVAAEAGYYGIEAGTHRWSSVPTGTAGAVATLSAKMTLDISGNLLLTSGTGALGYGTGAGGTVTQLTSKSTAVTLNKPSGVIFTSSSALAAGASAVFTFNNNSIRQYDNLITSGNDAPYRVEASATGNGYCSIRITNLTGSSLSQVVEIAFQIIRGATA